MIGRPLRTRAFEANTGHGRPRTYLRIGRCWSTEVATSLLPRGAAMKPGTAMQSRTHTLSRAAPAGPSGDNEEAPLVESSPGPSTKTLLSDYRLILLAVLLLGATIAAVTGSGTMLTEAVEAAVAGDVSGVGAAIFVGAYALATVLLFPASILTLAAGALFGPLEGTVLVSFASTLGATLAFLISRYLARPLVEAKLPEYPKLQTMIKGISSQGIQAVVLLRLSPLFPFNLLNYALGLTEIGLGQYVFASWAGMLPGTFAYVFLGGVGRVAADSAVSGFEPVKVFLYVVGAAATLAVTKLVSDISSKALQEQEEGRET